MAHARGANVDTSFIELLFSPPEEAGSEDFLPAPELPLRPPFSTSRFSDQLERSQDLIVDLSVYLVVDQQFPPRDPACAGEYSARVRRVGNASAIFAANDEADWS